MREQNRKKIKKKENLNEVELRIPSYLLEKPHWKSYEPLADRWKIPIVPKLSSTKLDASKCGLSQCVSRPPITNVCKCLVI